MYEQNAFSKPEHTTFEESKAAPRVENRQADAPRQVTGNPTANTITTNNTVI